MTESQLPIDEAEAQSACACCVVGGLNRWHIFMGWMPHVPSSNMEYARIYAVTYARCLGCGRVKEFSVFERHQWTPAAARSHTRWIQTVECPACRYAPEENPMPALAEAVTAET